MILDGAKGRQIIEEIERMERQEVKERKARKIDPDLHTAFETFWYVYPHKVGKKDAAIAYTSAVHAGGQVGEILVGLQRYIETKPADRPWLNPGTFLRQERWNDQPAMVVKGRSDAFGMMAGFLGGSDEDLQHGGTRHSQQAFEPTVRRLPGI